MISYSDQTFSIYSQFHAFTKSFWCIFFLFALFLVFLRPRNCSEHWVIFLFLSILFAKSRLSFNLLQGKEAKYIFLKKDSMFLLKPCVIPSCLCQIFFFLTESWLFSITDCFDFCFSLPISLNFIIPWYIFRFPQWRSNKTFEQPVLLLPWHDCDIINTTCQSKKRAKRNRQQEKSLQIFRCVPHTDHGLTKH